MRPAVMRPAARRFTQLIFFVTLLTVSYLALTPTPPREADLGWDKLNHFSAFGTLTVLACLGWPWPRRVALALLAYGGLIELLQTQVPGRSAEWADLLADGIGILIGLACLHLLPRLQHLRERLTARRLR